MVFGWKSLSSLWKSQGFSTQAVFPDGLSQSEAKSLSGYASAGAPEEDPCPPLWLLHFRVSLISPIERGMSYLLT